MYMAGGRFGARAFASNFTDSELAGAIDLLHSKGMKGYVTVNTLIKDSEMEDALRFITMVEELGADAVIIQDKGLLERLEGYSIPLHASTQMGLHNREGLEWARSKGISRAILARELSIEELEVLAESDIMELEVFVHGALCYSVSGQCLFSSMLGGRSGNRGSCAQPCRKRYSTSKGSGNILSTADLECLELIPRLKDAGIAAAKVEGRMRSPLYVYLAGRVYSSAIRGETVDAGELEMLRTVFNRGHGQGHMMGSSIRQTDFADNRGLPLGEWRFQDSVLVERSDNTLLRGGDGISLYQKGKVGGFRIIDPDRVTSPFPLTDGIYRAYRSHDSRFDEIIPTIHTPSLKGKVPTIGQTFLERDAPPRKKRRGELSVYLSSIRSLEAVVDLCHRVYFEDNRHTTEALRICEDHGVESVISLPRFTPVMPDMPDSPLMVHDPGQALAFRSRRLYASHHLNLFNSSNPPALYQHTVSPELNSDEIRVLADNFGSRLEMMVFGRTELMLARDPTLEEGTLTDGKGYRFPINKDVGGTVRVVNSADLVLLEHLEELDSMGIDSHGIDLRRRPADLCRNVMEIFSQRDMSRRRELRKLCGKVTYGHFHRGV